LYDFVTIKWHSEVTTMEWTEEELSELTRQYARIGYVQGERWPAPPDHLKPADLLELFRRIPDGGGRDGYFAELARTAPS
jgi:hypothetical protein